jgi:predicted DNA-binding transcriptional regulator AlpA
MLDDTKKEPLNSTPAAPARDDRQPHIAYEDDLITAKEACKIIGGKSAPIHIATLFRGVREGRFPKQYKVGLKTARWSRAECEAVVRKIGASRGKAA